MIYMNGRNADNEIIGSQELQRVYCGDQMIWQRNPISPWDKYEKDHSNAITVVLLDEFGEETDEIRYFDSTSTVWREDAFSDALNWLDYQDGLYNLYYGDNVYIPSNWIYYMRIYNSATYHIKFFRYPRHWTAGGLHGLESDVSTNRGFGYLDTVVLPETWGSEHASYFSLENNFFKNTGVKNIVFRCKEIGNVGDGCFQNCQNLKEIKFPHVYGTINRNAFLGCDGITIRFTKNTSGSVSGAPWGATNANVIWQG